jgi:maltose O-acetyltransferase
VTIGEKCAISHNVRIYTQTYFPNQDFSSNELKIKIGNIEIGNYVWIGINVFINPGITIDNNSIIGANSVVTKDIPDNAIAAGVPAKLIKYKT